MTRPRWFLPVSVVALLWNLMGCAAYLRDVSLTPADVAAMPAAQQALYHARPAWAVAAYAFAVWGGAVGSLGLVLRKRWAQLALLVSVGGLVAQDAALFGLSPVPVPPVAYGLQGMVFVIALLLVWLARTANRRGWTS